MTTELDDEGAVLTKIQRRSELLGSLVRACVTGSTATILNHTNEVVSELLDIDESLMNLSESGVNIKALASRIEGEITHKSNLNVQAYLEEITKKMQSFGYSITTTSSEVGELNTVLNTPNETSRVKLCKKMAEELQDKGTLFRRGKYLLEKKETELALIFLKKVGNSFSIEEPTVYSIANGTSASVDLTRIFGLTPDERDPIMQGILLQASSILRSYNKAQTETEREVLRETAFYTLMALLGPQALTLTGYGVTDENQFTESITDWYLGAEDSQG